MNDDVDDWKIHLGAWLANLANMEKQIIWS